MKFILIAISMIILAGSLCLAQEHSIAGTFDNNTQLLRLHYENASGEKGVTTFQYDSNGKTEFSLWELLNGKRNSFNEYSCDESGRMIRKYREFSDSLTSTEIFEYDNQGRLFRETFERSDTVGGSATYEYDDQNRNIKLICDKYKGWITAVIEYEYNDQNQKLKGTLGQDTNVVGIITYEYYDNGNLKREHWDFNGKWSQTFIYEFEDKMSKPINNYTSSNPFIPLDNGYRISGENYTYNGETGGPSYYYYNANNRLDTKKFVRDDGLSTQNRYMYDAKGRLTKARRIYTDGKTAVITYIFDDRNRMIERSLIRPDSVISTETFNYDDQGRMISAVYDNMDTWLTGTIDFKHHDDGRIKSGLFNAGKFTADISFDYDKNKNPIKIHWAFSFGESQTYTFEYEKLK